MTKVDTFTYRVQPGEVITLKVKLIGLGESMVKVSRSFTRVAGQSLTWEKTIPATGTKKVFTVIVEVSFPDTGSGAKADISLEGGGSTFSLPTIRATSAIKDPDISFRIP
jgi:hypothetical protein